VFAIYYEQLALGWRPQGQSDSQFKLIVAITIAFALVFSLIMSSIDVPEPDRQAKVAVPERIANFILEKKEKPKPKVVKPKPKPKPIVKPKPKVKKITKKKVDKKPLTKTQKKARDKAADTGLLALGNELADLMDTSDVSAMVGAKVKSSSASANKVASVDTSALTADASKGSGGVKSSQYATRVGKTQLSQREITQVKQSLLSEDAINKDAKRKSKSRIGGVRAEEEITIIFDQNKSKLYSIYNRARRKNPNLKGTIVLAITIAPSGVVSKIKIVSSELNDSKLERRLLNRIKQFKFGAKKVEPVTVTYPIEFLPS